MVEMNNEENRQLRGLCRALGVVREADPDMAIQTLHVFAEIAAYEKPMPMLELNDRIGMSGAAISRIVSRLQEFDEKKKPGLGWISKTEDPYNRRSKLVSLTAKGAIVARKMLYRLS